MYQHYKSIIKLTSFLQYKNLQILTLRAPGVHVQSYTVKICTCCPCFRRKWELLLWRNRKSCCTWSSSSSHQRSCQWLYSSETRTCVSFTNHWRSISFFSHLNLFSMNYYRLKLSVRDRERHYVLFSLCGLISWVTVQTGRQSGTKSKNKTKQNWKQPRGWWIRTELR